MLVVIGCIVLDYSISRTAQIHVDAIHTVSVDLIILYKGSCEAYYGTGTQGQANTMAEEIAETIICNNVGDDLRINTISVRYARRPVPAYRITFHDSVNDDGSAVQAQAGSVDYDDLAGRDLRLTGQWCPQRRCPR